MNEDIGDTGADAGREGWRPLLARVVKRTPAYLRLGWALARSEELEGRRKAGLLGGVLYSLSPVDLVPGIIPVFGQLDDMAALLYGIRATLRRLPPDAADRYLSEQGLTREMLDDDIAALGVVFVAMSRVVAKGAWRGARGLARTLHRSAASGARTIRRRYQERRSEPETDG